MKIALLITALIFLAVYLYNKSRPPETVTQAIPYGPFTIQVTASTSKGFNMNYGLVNYTNVAYGILYQGKPVVFPGPLQNNTGLPFLWAVYALPDAPDPTLIAGSQSLYLIYLKNGEPVVEPLVQQGSDFTSLQFLDSQNGQPGPFAEVFMKNEATNLEQLDSLRGGRYLLVSEHAVLDVQTRKVTQMNRDNNPVENYSYPSPHGALAFSPDRKSIVFRAEFQSWNTPDKDLPDSEHGLVVYDFEKDSGYVVKYDDTDTRLNSIQEADLHWFTTYFEWVNTQAGDRLQLRTLQKLPNWTGRYNPQDSYYYLYPVKTAMVPVFLDFVLDQMGWTQANILKDETGEYTGRVINLGAGPVKLDITWQEDDQKISLSRYLYDERSPENDALVRKLAEAFNAGLAAGKHQEHFGRIVSETKRIRGVK